MAYRDFIDPDSKNPVVISPGGLITGLVIVLILSGLWSWVHPHLSAAYDSSRDYIHDHLSSTLFEVGFCSFGDLDSNVPVPFAYEKPSNLCISGDLIWPADGRVCCK